MKFTLEQQQEGQSLYNELVKKAWEDSSFKKELIENPATTMSKFMSGLDLSNNNIIVEDQTDENIIYLNIPRKVNIEDLILSEEQLDKVSGGGPGYDFGAALANFHVNMLLAGAALIQRTFK